MNIAVELAANPQMLFLDEPTSGLDSAGARKVMKYVKKLSRQGRTIMYDYFIDHFILFRKRHDHFFVVVD